MPPREMTIAAMPAQDRPRAMLLMIGAVLLFAFLDSFAKLSGQAVPVLEVVWFRFSVHFVLAAIVFNPWRSPSSWQLGAPGLQFTRASIQIICTAANFLALTHLQIAQTLSIQFATPIFVTLLSVLLLGETVSRYRWCAIAVGFCGVLIVTRPGASDFHWAFLVSIGSVMLGANYNILTRRLAGSETSGSMLLMMAGVPMVVLTPFLPLFWQDPGSARAWFTLIATGIVGAVSHFLMIAAHRLAPASFLAPVQYIQFAAVLACGFVIFGDEPTVWTFLGGSIIAASCLSVWYRERNWGGQTKTNAPMSGNAASDVERTRTNSPGAWSARLCSTWPRPIPAT